MSSTVFIGVAAVCPRGAYRSLANLLLVLSTMAVLITGPHFPCTGFRIALAIWRQSHRLLWFIKTLHRPLQKSFWPVCLIKTLRPCEMSNLDKGKSDIAIRFRHDLFAPIPHRLDGLPVPLA